MPPAGYEDVEDDEEFKGGYVFDHFGNEIGISYKSGLTIGKEL
jgi:hypothetical protein